MPENTFSIYQLKDGDATRDLRFEPLEQVKAAGLRVDRDNYELVYTAPLSDTDTLEDIFVRFNMDRPPDFTGHSLSMSDVIVLHRGEQETAHYLDRGGYTEVPEFLQPEQTAEQEAQADAPPAERPLTELQKQAVEIAKRYETLSMQEKIGIIAQAFGCTSGTIETSPCTGKWRGTSDISIRFDNGGSLFLGNHITRQARTKKVQQELVDSALVRYNPEIIRIAKETAYTALKERELQDNTIAAEKGLKPYTLLNVEFNDGADQQSSGYIGWYYATLAVDGKICTHLETGLNHDIAYPSLSRILCQGRKLEKLCAAQRGCGSVGKGQGRTRNASHRVRAVYAAALQPLRAGAHRCGYAGKWRSPDAGADGIFSCCPCPCGRLPGKAERGRLSLARPAAAFRF